MENQLSLETINYPTPWLPIKTWEITNGGSVDPDCYGWNSWHYHGEVEFLAILEGSMKVETVDKVYELKANLYSYWAPLSLTAHIRRITSDISTPLFKIEVFMIHYSFFSKLAVRPFDQNLSMCNESCSHPSYIENRIGIFTVLLILILIPQVYMKRLYHVIYKRGKEVTKHD